jgi:hypothetical protein
LKPEIGARMITLCDLMNLCCCLFLELLKKTSA